MHKTIARRHRLQQFSSETPVKSRQRNGFTKVENSVDGLGLRRVYKDTYRMAKDVIYRCGGACDWTNEKWADELGMSASNWKAHKVILIRARLLSRQQRRLHGCRKSLTSILRIVGGGAENRPVKIKEKIKDLNTSTKAPREDSRTPSKPSYAKERWEHHRARNHSPAMKRLYEENGALQAENRGLRQERAHRSTARVPSSDTFATPPQEFQEKYRREMDEMLDRISPGWRKEVGHGL